jgi:hypothetical protein
MKKKQTINLATYCPSELKLLTGRDNGIEMRKKLKLEEYENNDEIDIIEIVVPKYIKTMTSSYILGLCSLYIEKNGEQNFRKKYNFICNSVIKNNIDIAIQYVITQIKEG